MTWQRIDENTYIDDTLVTCAEYQLFIDEMREQGKYYQPDHWTSYQFQAGQAREPVLGVRHSCAIAFCEWISAHEEKAWKYRLPKKEEAKVYPVKGTQNSILGYWIGWDFQFAWADSIPNNTNILKLDQIHTLVNTIVRDLEQDMELTVVRANISTGIHTFPRTTLNVIDYEAELMLSQPIGRVQLQVRSATRALMHIIAPEVIRKQTGRTALNLALKVARFLDVGFILNHSLNRAIALHVNVDDAIPVIIEAELNEIRDVVSQLDNTLGLSLALTTVVTSDLLTIKDRVYGRSPAFEGIRLVKERIK
jgi:hypothetical protein